MKINIVTVNSGWILQNIAQRIAMSNSDIFEVSYKPKDNVNANYYVDITDVFDKKIEMLNLLNY